ncbi:hypothetical protein GCM10028804_05520 [Larkinella terrae]
METLIGVYNPNYQPDRQPVKDLYHLEIVLDRSTDPVNLQDRYFKIQADLPYLITLKISDSFGRNSLNDLRDGSFDEAIQALCAEISAISQPVYLRLCPEMEVPVHRFNWQYQSPVTYIQAFQRVSRLCKARLPAVQMVWAPAGYPGADEYWPGDSAVDLISITVDSPSEQLTTAYPRIADPYTAIRRKLHRLRFMPKTVLILGDQSVKKSIDAGQLTKTLARLQQEETALFPTLGSPRAAVSAKVRTARPEIGVYDPKELLVKNQALRAEHLFFDLESIQTGTFRKALNATLARRHDVILTIEPWRDTKPRRDTCVLCNVTNGVYDEEFREVYRAISRTRQTVYLRFAHEMEIPIRRYAWQSQDPILYIRAYRYFMTFDSAGSRNIKKVWGPAGDRGSMEWWPGADVVDYISVAIYGLPDKNITDPRQQETFRDIFNRKFYRMRFSSKPLFITEFGVKGPEDFQRKWLNDAADVIRNQPDVVGVCYFNLADNPKVWGNMPAPDWSISPATFNHFVSQLNPNL